jgi:hypothetical protein
MEVKKSRKGWKNNNCRQLRALHDFSKNHSTVTFFESIKLGFSSSLQYQERVFAYADTLCLRNMDVPDKGFLSWFPESACSICTDLCRERDLFGGQSRVVDCIWGGKIRVLSLTRIRSAFALPGEE